MKPPKYLLITFDYELFLGSRSGTVDKCLIYPTNIILDLLRRFNIQSVFFIDTVYLSLLKKHASQYKSLQNDFDKISQQLQSIKNEGHELFPHIHPHWLDALYDAEVNQWELAKLEKYRFHDISMQERDSLFADSINILKEIILPACPGYVIDSYRAGGWGIQPFSDFKPFFDKYGILFDFSVLPGFSENTSAHVFDFMDAPVKSIYSFQDDVLREEENGKFREFCISSLPIGSVIDLINRIFLKINSRSSEHRCFGKGISVAPVRKGKTPAGPGKVKREMISIENLNSVKLPMYNSFLSHNNYMHFISHPKMLTPHNLANFEKFLNSAFSRHEIETCFRKMK